MNKILNDERTPSQVYQVSQESVKSLRKSIRSKVTTRNKDARSVSPYANIKQINRNSVLNNVPLSGAVSLKKRIKGDSTIQQCIFEEPPEVVIVD